MRPRGATGCLMGVKLVSSDLCGLHPPHAGSFVPRVIQSIFVGAPSSLMSRLLISHSFLL